MRTRVFCPQRLSAFLFVAARLAALGESVDVEHVLGPSSFRAADGRIVHYLGLSSPEALESADRRELWSQLTQQHRDLLLGKAIDIVLRTHGNHADKPVPAFVFHRDTLLNIEALRLGLAVLDARALGKLGAYEEQFLQAQLEAGKEGRGIWREEQLRGLLAGSRRSQKAHQPFCPWAYKIGARNRVLFPDAEAALAAGMTACAICFPGQGSPRLQAEGPEASSASVRWAIGAVALCVCGVLAGLLARTARAKLFLRALKRMRDNHQALLDAAAPPPASTHRPPARRACDLLGLLARYHLRWKRYLAGRSILWYSESPPDGAIAVIPEADIKRLLTSVLVHLRDRLPKEAAIHSRLSTSPDTVVLAFSVSVPSGTFGEVVPPEAAIRAWSATLPKEPASIEVFAEPGKDGHPHPLLAIVLPKEG